MKTKKIKTVQDAIDILKQFDFNKKILTDYGGTIMNVSSIEEDEKYVVIY
jgi:cAMP phosphodiesterase